MHSERFQETRAGARPDSSSRACGASGRTSGAASETGSGTGSERAGVAARRTVRRLPTAREDVTSLASEDGGTLLEERLHALALVVRAEQLGEALTLQRVGLAQVLVRALLD